MTTMTAPLPLASAARRVTPGELYELIDRNGYELIDGQLEERPVSRESSRIGARIVRLLGNEAERTGEAEVYGADLGYQCFRGFAPPETVRRADASLIRRDRLANVPGDPGYMPIPPDLAVEVLSPTDSVRRLNDKIELYLAAGYRLIWIVDPVTAVTWVHRHDGTVVKLRAADEVTGESALPGFHCRVAALLAAPTP